MIRSGPDLLSAGPCSEKMWGLSSEAVYPIFHRKNWRPRRSPIISGMQKFAAAFVGPPFCGSPCSAEHAEHA